MQLGMQLNRIVPFSVMQLSSKNLSVSSLKTAAHLRTYREWYGKTMASDSTKSAEDEARQKKCNSYLKRTRPVGMAEAAAPVPHTHPVSLGAGFAPPPIGANPALPGMFGSAATTDTSGSNPSGSAPYQSSTRILAAVPPQIGGRLQCSSCGGIYSKASPDYICHK